MSTTISRCKHQGHNCVNCMKIVSLTGGNQEVSQPFVKQSRVCNAYGQSRHTRKNCQTTNDMDLQDEDKS